MISTNIEDVKSFDNGYYAVLGSSEDIVTKFVMFVSGLAYLTDYDDQDDDWWYLSSVEDPYSTLQPCDTIDIIASIDEIPLSVMTATMTVPGSSELFDWLKKKEEELKSQSSK